MVTEVKIKRLTFGSVFKTLFFGMVFGFLFLGIIAGIAGFLGAGVVTFNGEQITGVKALLVAPVIMLFLGVFFSLFLTPIVWFGQLLSSKIKKSVTLKYIGE